MVGRITQTPHQLPKDGGRETGDGGRGGDGHNSKKTSRASRAGRGAAHP